MTPSTSSSSSPDITTEEAARALDLHGGEVSGNRSVPVDIYETHEALVVVAAMPGVMPEDVRVSVDGNVRRLHAELRTVAAKLALVHEWECRACTSARCRSPTRTPAR